MPTASPPASALGAELEHRVSTLWWLLSREAPTDLSRSAASVLGVLRADGPQRVTVLAAQEHIAQPTMTALLQRLQRLGLVERREDPDDRRACRMAITTAGEDALLARATARAASLDRRLGLLAPDQREAIAGALEALDATIANGATA